MKHVNFVHLHNHTQYSLLDGACQLDRFFDRAVELKFPAIAMTDHGNMFGTIDFYKKAMAKGLKPIIGMEAYVAPGSRFDKTSHGIKDAAYHLVLLAKNEKGYRNLIKLSSAGFLEGFYYKPRVDKQILKEFGGGLIALSACLKGEVAQHLYNNRHDEARRAIGEYQDIFGKENFYLEIHDHDIEEEKIVLREIVKLSREMNIPLVATNDVHYVYRKDALSHEVLLCLQTGTTLADQNRMRMSTNEFYMKSYEEMQKLFADYPEALTNAYEIAQHCNVEFDFKKTHLPYFEPPTGKTQFQYLRELCDQGLAKRFGVVPEKYLKQLEFELGVIEKMGYTSYFLIVSDFIRYSRENGIFVGPGRGSAAGSIVSYALQITEVDPLRFGLLFERFLNPERVSMPDIDIDFCYERRVEVIEYVERKYGRDNVAQIITFGTMKARMVIRDIGRVLGLSYQEVDAIAKLVPEDPKMTIKKALNLEPRLAELARKNDNVKKILDIAEPLEGLMRHASTHAAGVVISDKPLTEHVPLYKADNVVMTQFTMTDLESIGLLKMDFLGLKTLTVIGNAVRIVKDLYSVSLDMSNLDLDDAKTYELLGKGETFGIFQLESSGMRDLIRKLKPDTIDEVADLLALYRPGPLGSGMVEDFIKRKHDKSAIPYDHPLLEPILKDTYGVILYQEQVMKIANVLGGFSLAQADNMRRAMGKKKPEVLEKLKSEFVSGAQKNNVPEATARKVFDLIEYFAGYGFNKSHSVAYSFISYQTAYLKANYPLAFMAALLTSEKDNTDKIVQYIDEARRMEIKVLPPSVNASRSEFTAFTDRTIRFGLSAIKNVGSTAIESIVTNRARVGNFTSIFHFVENLDLRLVNRKVIESLIKSGALDCFNLRRSQMMLMVDKLLDFGAEVQQDKSVGQFGLFDGGKEEDKYSSLLQDIPAIDEWPESQLLDFEKETLGFYVTSHPLSRFSKMLETYATIQTDGLGTCREQQEVLMGGIIAAKREHTTKKKELMAFVTLEDLKGKTEVIFFPEAFQSLRDYLQDGKIVFIKGVIDARSEMPKVIANDVFALDEVRKRMTKSLTLHFSTVGLSQDTLNSVKTILQRYPGKTSITFKFKNAAGNFVSIVPSPDFFVTVDDRLFDDIEALLGPDSLTAEV